MYERKKNKLNSNIQFNNIKIGFDEYKIGLLKDCFIRALNKKDNYIIKESK